MGRIRKILQSSQLRRIPNDSTRKIAALAPTKPIILAEAPTSKSISNRYSLHNIWSFVSLRIEKCQAPSSTNSIDKLCLAIANHYCLPFCQNKQLYDVSYSRKISHLMGSWAIL
jgi:hypothetical protein